MAAFASFGTGQWNEADTVAQKPDSDALETYYQEQSAQDLQRKLSRSKSQQNKPAGGRSFFTRKGSRKAGVAEPSAPIPLRPSLARRTSKTDEKRQSAVSTDTRSVKTDRESTFSEKSDLKLGPLSTSIIPDTLAEDHIPAWLLKDFEATSQVNLFRVKHPISNPVGPQWYKNIHLLPPSYLQPQSRPPSFFSPSFPPMAATRERSLEVLRPPPGQRASPSASPNSSQVGIVEPGKRSRKTSQTAQDQVDFLDVSDPTGAQWHHESPYDSGTPSSSGPIESSSHGHPAPMQSTSSIASVPRSRRASFTLPRKTAPSPLSQSTSASAIQLPLVEPPPASLPRRPIKVRSALMGGFSVGSGSSSTPPLSNRPPHETALSDPGPITQSEERPPLPPKATMNSESDIHNARTSMDTPPIQLNPMQVPDKKEKRGSMLGRFARRLSTIKKAAIPSAELRAPKTDSPNLSPRTSQQAPDLGRPKSTQSLEQTPTVLSPEEEMKSLVMGVLPLMPPTPPAIGNDSDNSIEVDPPLTLGKLHIVNPDESPLPSPVFPSAPYRSSTGTSSTETVLPPLPSAAARNTATPEPFAVPRGTLESDSSTPRASQHVDFEEPEPTTPVLRSQKQVPPPPPSDSEASTGRATVPSIASSHDSPASVTSMLANPPTPHTEPEAMAPLVPKKTAASPTKPTKPTEPAEPAERKPVPPEKERSPVKGSSSSKVQADVPTRPPTTRAGSSGSVPTRQTDTRHTDTRHTETYKLVRHPSSDKPTASNGTFSAGGEQWKVVGAAEGSRLNQSGRRSSRSRDDRASLERRSSPEKRSSREGRSSPDKKSSSHKRPSPEKRPSYQDKRPPSREGRSSRDYNDRSDHRREAPSDRREEPSSSRREMYSNRRRDAQSSSESVHEISRQERRRSGTGTRPPTHSSKSRSADVQPSQPLQNRSSRSSGEHSRHKSNLEKPQPAPPPPTPRHPPGGLDKQLSTSARPTSEMPSAADMSAMRAREAWDLDRLYKGRSMHYDMDKDQHLSATYPTMAPVPFPVASTPYVMNEYPAAGHGSSHTNFTVQTPFPVQSNANNYYSNMPVAPPPIVYASIYRQAAPHASTHAPPFPQPTVVQPPTLPSPIFDEEPSNSQNPLPAPPRASSYKPGTSLPPNDPDFWTQLTAAH